MLSKRKTYAHARQDYVSGFLSRRLELERLFPNSGRATENELYACYLHDLAWVNTIVREQFGSTTQEACPRKLFTKILRSLRKQGAGKVVRDVARFEWCMATFEAIEIADGGLLSGWHHSVNLRAFARQGVARAPTVASGRAPES